MIDKVNDLQSILGSKYVQSDTVEAYKQVKQALIKGRIVLYSGCSCQIVGLKNFLDSVDKTNLYTIDLICHGVPGVDLFNDYIGFLENKYGDQVTQLYFRTKENDIIVFRVTAQLDGHGGIGKQRQIPMRESGYFRMFMAEESYREACYQCPYASVDKPADITIGDYFEIERDYPELLKGEAAIDCNGGVSCVIIHSSKGEELLRKAQEYIFLKEVDPKVVQASHRNLHRASKYSSLRKKLFNRYQKHGYKVIEQYYDRRNALVAIPRKLVG